MVIGIIVWLIGAAIVAIKLATIRYKEGVLTIQDLLIDFIISICSWFTIIVSAIEWIGENWEENTEIWRKKK